MSPKPITLQRLRAQHANAAHSTGPKTREGRRRVALNPRRFIFSETAREMMERLGGDPQEYQRIWRDLVGIFEFMGPQMEDYVAVIAWDWWLKAHYARRDRTPKALEGREDRFIQLIDARLENELLEMVGAYQIFSRQWRHCLEREIGCSVELGAWRLRLAVETRLGTFQKLAAEGKLAAISPLEQALCQAVEDLQSFGVAFSNL